jgi:ribosomal protein S18 acetylase RimI-like enzyme
MVEFRKANLGDFQTLSHFKRSIHSMHVEHAPNFYRDVSDPLSLDEFKAIIGGKDRRSAYVLLDNGELAAYAFTNVVEIQSNPVIYDQRIFFIEDMFVEQRLRRRGHGRRLMKELQQIAAQNGCGSIALEVWEWNSEAISFYKALGLQTTQLRMKLWV